jgi:hypothetical protein
MEGDIPDGSPLLTLGLVDPRGNAVPTDDWPGPEGNPPGEANGTNDKPTTTQGAAPTTQGTEGTQPGTSQVNWDDPSNPYKPDPVTQSRQTYAATVQQLQNEVPVAVATLVAQGWQQEAAQAMVNTMLQAGVATARTNADRIAMLPYAKQANAEQIATKYSTSNVAIEPKELLGEPTVDAMEAKARTIVAERRDRVVTQRATAGSDRVERTGQSGTIDYGQLSPHQMISLGLRRGQ